MILKRIEPLSLAKISGVVYAVAGLLIGLIISIGSLLGAATAQGGGVNMLFGLGAVLVLPILYGGIGFASSWFLAFVYNWMAKKVGGVQLDLQ